MTVRKCQLCDSQQHVADPYLLLLTQYTAVADELVQAARVIAWDLSFAEACNVLALIVACAGAALPH